MIFKVLHVLLLLFTLASLTHSVTTEELYKGVLSLDELTFDKVVSRFRYALVKFDHPYPYGVDHENFVRLGKQLAKLKRTDVIAVNLEVKDYGEQDSLVLTKRYSVPKEDFPALRLFVTPPNCKVANFTSLKPVVYDEERNLTTNKIHLDPVSMRLFFWRETGIHVTLPNCTADLDQLAASFLQHISRKSAEQPLEGEDLQKAQKIISQVESMSKKSSTEKRKAAAMYLKYMQKGLERGLLFFESEEKRILNLLIDVKENITAAKRKVLQAHFNVLQSFRVNQYPEETPDEQLISKTQTREKSSPPKDTSAKAEL